MLVIVNPYATTSRPPAHLVVYALRAATRSRPSTPRARHATELSRAAAQEDYDIVVAFGGDGTVNEAATGSPTPARC